MSFSLVTECICGSDNWITSLLYLSWIMYFLGGLFRSTLNLMPPYLHLSASSWAQPSARSLYLPLSWGGAPLKHYPSWSLHHCLWTTPRNFIMFLTENILEMGLDQWPSLVIMICMFPPCSYFYLHPISSTGSHKNYLGWAASFCWNSRTALGVCSCTSWCRTFHLHLDMIYWSKLENITPPFQVWGNHVYEE